MTNTITEGQLTALGCCYVLGTMVVSSFITAVAGRDAWLMGLWGLVLFAPALLCWLGLIRRHPGMGLFDILEAVLGPALGRAVSLIFLIFFMALCALNVREATGFIHGGIMPDVPLAALAALFAAVCVYGARKGLGPMARLASAFCIAACGGLALSLMSSLGQADFGHLLPTLNGRSLDYIQAGHIAAAIPYGEGLVLLMLVPRLDGKARAGRALTRVAGFTAAVMTLVHLREVLTLGPLAAYLGQPSFEAVRMAGLTGAPARTESLFALLLVSLTFFKTLILFYVCLIGLKQVFRLEGARALAVPLALLLTAAALGVCGPQSDAALFGKNSAPFIWSAFTFVLPAVTLLTSHLRGTKKEAAS